MSEMAPDDRKKEAARRLRNPPRSSICHGVFADRSLLDHLFTEEGDSAFVGSALYCWGREEGWVLIEGANAVAHDP